MSKLKEVAPKLWEQYSKRVNNIYNEIDFKEDVTLTDIPDSNHSFLPKDKSCKTLQVAIRNNFIQPNEKRFIVRKDLWEKFDNYNKAGLIMHELIYEHFSALGESDSQKARKFNSFIFSKEFSAKEFWAYIKNLQVAIYP